MKVLEISASSAAGYAGLLLSELGHEVHQLRLSGDDDDAVNLFLHRDKQVVDPRELAIEGYDGVIEDVGEAVLGELGTSFHAIMASSTDMVLVSLSPFGLNGPCKDWAASELVIQAAGGVLHVSGYDGEAPRKLPGDTALMICGLHGATAMMAARLGVARGVETGVHIDISAQDTLMQHWTRHISQYAYSGTTMRRGPKHPRGIHAHHTARASDGWVYMLALRAPWQQVAEFLGLGEYVDARPDESTDAAQTGQAQAQPWEAMEEAFHRAIAGKTRYQWFADAAEVGWTFAPVEDPLSLMCNPQNEARGFFKPVEHKGVPVKVPGLPFRTEQQGEFR